MCCERCLGFSGDSGPVVVSVIGHVQWGSAAEEREVARRSHDAQEEESESACRVVVSGISYDHLLADHSALVVGRKAKENDACHH